MGKRVPTMVCCPTHRCFWPHRDGRVDLIVNWHLRRRPEDPLVLIPLSPRHLAIWRALRRRCRSDKSILYALSGRTRRGVSRLAVPIPLGGQSDTGLVRLVESRMGQRIPGLRQLPREGLIGLVRGLYRSCPEGVSASGSGARFQACASASVGRRDTAPPPR